MVRPIVIGRLWGNYGSIKSELLILNPTIAITYRFGRDWFNLGRLRRIGWPQLHTVSLKIASNQGPRFWIR
jgi:hypothetical protein